MGNGGLLNDKYSPVKRYTFELFDTLNTETVFGSLTTGRTKEYYLLVAESYLMNVF